MDNVRRKNLCDPGTRTGVEPRNRIALGESPLAKMALQLLPGPLRDLDLLERACRWQADFARCELAAESTAVIAASGDAQHSELLLHSLAVQSLQPAEVHLISKFAPASCSLATEFSVEAGSGLGVDALKRLLPRINSRFVLIVDDGLLLNPQALFVAVKNAVLERADMLFFNHLLTNERHTLPSKFLRRTLPGAYDLLSYNHLGRCLLFRREELDGLLDSSDSPEPSPATLLWELGGRAFDAGMKCVHVPLAATFQSERSFLEQRPRPAEVERTARALAQRAGLEVREIFHESAGRLADRAVTLALAPPAADLRVVIPFRNRAEDTLTCLESLSRQKISGQIYVSLINNNSDGEALDQIRAFIERHQRDDFCLEIIDDSGYFNFARLINAGVRRGDEEFVLLLNNDVEFIGEAVLSTLLGWMLPGVGIVGGKLYYPDNSIQHAGIAFSPLGPKNVDSPGELADICREVDGVSFAMALVRRTVFSDAGLLDEFVCPNGFGDALFCETARGAGWRTVYLPRAAAFHYESASRKEQIEDQERLELSRAGIEIAERYRDFHSQRRAEEFDILGWEPVDRLAQIVLANKPVRRVLNALCGPILRLGRSLKHRRR